MKFKLLSIFVAIAFVLFGCATGNDNQEGTMDRNNNTNIEPTRYNDNDRTNERLGANDNRENGTDGLLNNNRDNDRNNLIDDNRNNDHRYDVSQKAADRIKDEINEIDYAYVLTTDNNAYVAATVNRDNQNNNSNGDHEDELTNEVKDKIANIVQSVDKDIDNVYVSTNPDFVNMVNDYADDVNNDRPIRGMFDELADMIERVFPQNQR